MAIERQGNWLGQMRVDAPHVRMLESAICNDFDVLANIVTGPDSYVVKGLELATWIVGQRADTLALLTAGGTIVHPNASESGSIFTVPESQDPEVLEAVNPNVQGSFTSNSTNYVGIDLVRSADSSTTDLVQFNSATTNIETGIRVPLARTLNYRIIISTSDFSVNSSVLPVAIITTDSTNKVLTVEDSRPLLFSLRSGGSVPNSQNVWGWPGGRSIGDLSISSFKDWMDSIMSRLWELGGGEAWESNTADRNVQTTYNAVFTTTGEPFDTITSAGYVLFKGVKFIFDNSTGHINEIQDQIAPVDLNHLTVDGDCVYVDLDRTQDRTLALANQIVAQKGNLNTLGTSSPPGSRYVLAAKVGAYYYTRGQYLPIGSGYRVATTAILGISKLSATPFTPLAPVVASISGDNFLIGGGGLSRKGTGTTGSIVIGNETEDKGVFLYATGENAVIVFGDQVYSDTNLAAFTVIQRHTGDYDSHVLDLEAAPDGPTVLAHYVDAQGAIGQTNTHYLPNNDLANVAPGVGGVNFMRPSKYWHEDVVAVYDGTVPLVYTVSTAGNGRKVLTSNTQVLLVVDGTSPFTVGDRILFDTDDVDSGLYEVVNIGGAGTAYWILERPVDFNLTSNVSQGIGVKVTAGNTFIGQYYVLSTLDPVVLETDSLVWELTDKLTTDQSCIKWGDGTVTIIAESQPYNTWLS